MRDRRRTKTPETRVEKREKLPLARGATAADDTMATMKLYELPMKFPKDVLGEAAKIGRQSVKNEKGRLDLRKKFIFTCDPETAKDFDDALSLEKDRKGNRTLGIHIADVSHYVQAGSAIDKEAYKRSTSVYLLDRVVPMLPEVLCNGLCSLVPNEDRLAFSVFLTYDKTGKCIGRKFAKSIIRSKARFTYEQVMAVIRGGGRKLPKNQRATICEISQLAQEMRAARFANGALDLEIPETEILLDDEGEMTGLAERAYDESHQMVEECMVAANEAVAKELWSRGIRILARLHETPDSEKLEELRNELALLGVKCGDISHGKNMAAFLKKIKGHPLEKTIAVMVLRSMKRAVYDSTKIGHFGLAKEYYAHFTSPIRRYPDLTLHRQLAAYLAGKGKEDRRKLAASAKHCSEMEERADEAERSLMETKKFRYLEEHGGTFDAVVSKVTNFGMFVDVPALATGGLVHVSEISHRYVRFNQRLNTLDNGRQTWKLGDKVKVRVLKADWNKRWIDFSLEKGE